MNNHNSTILYQPVELTQNVEEFAQFPFSGKECRPGAGVKRSYWPYIDDNFKSGKDF
jgi:hypothetical protein